MKDDLPEPRGRGMSDIEMFEEIWHLVKTGIILCVLLSGMAFIAGLVWGFLAKGF